jgi:DNA-nicking Smr family endonuclease
VLTDSLSDHFDYSELETGDELWFSGQACREPGLRKLRRGQFSLQSELDLHGMTVATARQALADFLQQCRGRGAYCIRVVHGKCRGSRQRQPVLR